MEQISGASLNAYPPVAFTVRQILEIGLGVTEALECVHLLLIPEATEEAVRRALEYDRSKRYFSETEMKFALKEALAELD